MFDLTFDIIVVLTCAAAVLYCRLLAVRLKRLHDLKSGIGEAIVHLSGAIKASTDANAAIARQANDALTELDQTMARLAKERQDAEDLLETLDGQVHQAKRNIGQPLSAAEKVAERLTQLTERSRVEMHALARAVAITNKVSMLVTPSDGDATGAKASLHRLSEEFDAAEATNPFRSGLAQTG